MIGKRMDKRRDGASIARQVAQLTAYIDRSASGAERGDILAQGQLNLIAETRSGQVAEMIATAMGAPRAYSPIEHIVLSWRASEQPTLAQAGQALAMLLEETGLRGHQVIWTLHLGASNNQHLHALMSRVAPDAEKATQVAFMHNAIGRSIARIEHVQGWQRESGAHFEVLEELTGEQHVIRYRTHRRSVHELGSHRSSRGTARTPRHGRDPEAAPRGERGGRSNRHDPRRPGQGIEETNADLKPAPQARGGSPGPTRRAAETSGGDRDSSPGKQPDPHYTDTSNGHSPSARRLAAVRLRRAALAYSVTQAQDTIERNGPYDEPPEGTLGAPGSGPLAAHRLAEIRMRFAHRATDAEAILTRSLMPEDALPAGAARAEIYRGEASAARHVIEIAGPIVTEAASWADLHDRLAEHGITYAAKGSGAVFIVDGGVMVKASTCRAASRNQLEKRFGPLSPGAESEALQSGLGYRREQTTVPSVCAAPGTDPELFTVAREAQMTASAARAAYDAVCPKLNVAPLLKAAVVGSAPRSALNARTLARQTGKPLPHLAPMQRPDRSASSVTVPIELYHAGLQADRYRVVAKRSLSQKPFNDEAQQRPGPDRLVQLSPQSMADVVASWTALEKASGSGSAVYLTPVSRERHHVVLSGLRATDVGRIQAAGFTPSLVLNTSDGRHEVVLTSSNANRSYEQAALAKAVEDLQLRLGIARSRIGLRIDDPAHPGPPPLAADDHGRRIYAHVVSATGAICETLGRLILHWIGVFAQRFGIGPSSRLGRAPGPSGMGAHADAPLYWAHRADLLAHWQGRWPDPSRVDALIGRRLLGTGHGEEAAAALITACAPLVPQVGCHVWTGYGRRAAAHAFRDKSDSAWAFDRASPALWAELEKAVKDRERSDKPKLTPGSLPPLTLPVPPPMKGESASGTTRKKRRDGRGDSGGPGGW